MAARDMSLLDLDLERSIPHFVAVAEDFEIVPERTPSGLAVESRLGRIELSAADSGTRITLRSEDGAQLQSLRDFLTERLEFEGVHPVWERAGRGRPGNMSLARVAAVERISPAYARVSLEGEDLARFGEGGFHFRLLFGPEGADWPGLDENGVTQWPGGAENWHRPVYTTRALEHLGGNAARIVFDVFQHDGGRTTEWTRALAPGDEIALTGPGGSGEAPRLSWLGLVGDETAVPVVARMLEACGPEVRGEAVLVVPERADIQPLDHPAGLSLRWEVRSEGGRAPLDALEEMQIPDADRYVFFAGEREDAVAARRSLAAAGLSKREFLAAAYWSAAPAE